MRRRPPAHRARPARAITDEDRAIAAHVAAIIPDGATLQVGVGGTPDAVLAALRDHRDIGVHSGLASDAMVELVEAGVITNARKEIDTGITTAGVLFGTERLFRWADGNPSAADAVRRLHPRRRRAERRSGRSSASTRRSRSTSPGRSTPRRSAAATSASSAVRARYARAGISSAGGRSIIALPSTARGGEISRIVPRLADGVVTTARADADVFVTEYGVADLRGQPLPERARRLIAISHPGHREALERQLSIHAEPPTPIAPEALLGAETHRNGTFLAPKALRDVRRRSLRSGGDAAVDGNVGAGHVRRLVRGQEQRDLGDLLGLPDAAQRRRLHHRAHHLGRSCPPPSASRSRRDGWS